MKEGRKERGYPRRAVCTRGMLVAPGTMNWAWICVRKCTGVIISIHEVDPEQPVYDVRPMDEVVERSLSQEWLNTALLSLFSSVSLVLATVGVYGGLSYSVGLRAREIGIRMALGSQRREVIWMVLRHGGFLAVLGTLIGVAGSLLLGRVLSALL